MKKQLMTGLFTVLALNSRRTDLPRMAQPGNKAVNRAPMHTNYFAFENAMQLRKQTKNNQLTT